MARKVWSSRAAFIFAAVGAAVGFGNIWRFPALAYSYGGGAFFVPYLLALLLVGMPLLLLEIGMGQMRRAGDYGVFHSVHRRIGGVGLASVLCGFFVTCYYVPLISWVVRAFVESFGHMSDDWEDISGAEASQYFYDDVIGMETLGDGTRPTRIVGANVAYLLFSWLCIGLCLAFGIKWTGRIAYVTMGLPLILLAFFFVRAVTLPGASEGIVAYIGEWDFSVLVNRPDCWSTAVSQIFFSLGVTFGVMTAFGSHCPPGAPAAENSVIIAVSNSFFSFVSGFAVFGVLGYLKNVQGSENINDVVQAGPALLFGAYPAALSTVPGGLHWVRFLFFNLFLLGIDSAFALVEAVLSVVKDSTYGTNVPQKALVGTIIGLGFLCGLMYATDAGLLFLDVVDFYINFVMLGLGFVKSFSAGWLYGLEKQIETFGERLVYGFMLATFAPLVLASWVWFGMDGNNFIGGFLLFFLTYVCGIAGIVRSLNNRTDPWKSALYELALRNVHDLRDELVDSVGNIYSFWAVLIKHFIPQVLLVLFFNLAWYVGCPCDFAYITFVKGIFDLIITSLILLSLLQRQD